MNPYEWGRTDKNARYIIDNKAVRKWCETTGGPSYLGQVGGHTAEGGNIKTTYELNPAAGCDHFRTAYNKKYNDITQIIDASGYPVAIWREDLKRRAEGLRRQRNAPATVTTSESLQDIRIAHKRPKERRTGKPSGRQQTPRRARGSATGPRINRVKRQIIQRARVKAAGTETRRKTAKRNAGKTRAREKTREKTALQKNL